MMKRVYILVILLFAALTINAQVADGKIQIENLTAVESDGEVEVRFDARIAKKTVGQRKAYAFISILTDGTYRVSLPAVVIDGVNTKVSRGRRVWAAGEAAGHPDAVYAKNGETVRYRAAVQAQEWMQGGKLGIEAVMAGCCTEKADPMVIIAENLKLYSDPKPIEVVTEVKVFKPQSVADSLSVIFPFIVPESMFDPEDPFKIYDAERDKSMIVYFRQSRHNIDYSYFNNGQTLTNLTAAVEMILEEIGNNVERVVVAGFASPEGQAELNDRLAFDRSVAVKQHLLRTTPLKDSQVWLHNGSVDWRGLRLLVEKSDMSEKQRILDIIDNTPIEGDAQRAGRLEELRRLNDGVPYRFMLREYFPLLRNGAFIKIYYSNQTDDSK